MHKPFFLAILLLPALAAAQPARREAAPAGPPAFSCPPHVRVTPEQRVQAPEGWRVQADSQMHWLRGAELFEGDPADRVQLREDGGDRATRREWWDLDPANPRTYHIVCRYEGLEAGIVAPVPRGLRRCTVETHRDNSRGVRHGRVVIGPDNWVRVGCR